MATNPLTGDYEAVFHIALRQVNALLGTLHQNGGTPEATMKLLHSARLSIGRPRRHPDLGGFGDWVNELHRSRRMVAASTLRHELVVAAPPGAAARLKDVFDLLDQRDPEPGPVRGRADVQLSTATVTVPDGSSREVVVRLGVRAEYRPAPGTSPLPAPIHGDVAAAFELRMLQSPSGRRLVVKPSPDDARISFHPAAGTLSGADAAAVATQIRRALRDDFTLVPIDLPAEFPFGEFKGLGSGASESLALGLQLTGAAMPSHGLQQVTQPITGPSGFAFAVSRDFVTAVFGPTLAALLQFEQTVPGPGSPFRVRITSATLQFNDGSIDLRIKAVATHRRFPNVDISVRQRLTLVLFLDRIFIAAPDDELSVSMSTRGIPLPSGRVKRRIIDARNEALPPAQNALNEQLAAARARFDGALRLFDPSATLKLRSGHSEEPGAAATGAIAITPHGIVVRGDLVLGARPAPIVDVQETPDETAFTALDSWIPAGRIGRFHWSWVEYTSPHAWSGVVKSLPVEHTFILPKPAGVTSRSQICLRLAGTVIGPHGMPFALAAGATCTVPVPDVIMDLPSWWEPVMVPLWQPGVAADGLVSDAISAHVSVQSDTAAAEPLTQNALVYFPDGEANAFGPLAEALTQMQRRGASLVVFVVLPAGAFAARRRELEAKLGAVEGPLASHLHLTEDVEGGWTRTFAPSRRPALFLINARRQFAWKSEGPLEPREVAAALDRHVDVAPPPRVVPLRLSVGPGDRVPDAIFEDHRGDEMALHRLQGQRVMLNFWQPWSAPCRRELDRLRTLHESGRDAPVIIAFQGGPKADLDEVRKQLRLSYPLVYDADHAIARLYGVRCWPTTITVDTGGRVEHVQFGVSPDRNRL
jgi:peroxiredoxin